TALSLIVASRVSGDQNRRHERAADATADRATDDCAEVFRRLTLELAAPRALYSANADLTRRQIDGFFATIGFEARYPGFVGAGMVTEVRHADERAFLDRRLLSDPEFKITPAGERDEYFLTEAAGLQREDLDGFDLKTLPGMAGALEHSRDTAQTTVLP